MPPLESGSSLPRLQPAQGCEGVATLAQVDSVEVVSVAEVVVVVGSSGDNLLDDCIGRISVLIYGNQSTLADVFMAT